MKYIFTNKGVQVTVDADDFEHVSKFKWRHDTQGYVCRSARVSEMTWHNRNQMWIARVRSNGKAWGKCFHTEQEAASAYNQKAKEVYGEFAVLNEV